jgi:hypothetical protein
MSSIPVTDTTTPRDQLRHAISIHTENQSRLNFLIQGQDRAVEERRETSFALDDARRDFTQTKQVEPSELAFAYARQEATQVRPQLQAAESLVTRLEAELSHYQSIEAALTGEITKAEAAVRRSQHNLDEAVGTVVGSSPELDALLQEIAHAWLRLRSVITSGRIILSACSGLDQSVYRRIQISEPLEADRVGYPVTDICEQWRSALSNLLTDADASLPGGE